MKEDASLAESAFHACPSAVGLGDMLDDCQSQSGAAQFSAARFVHSIKSLEDPRQMFPADPASVVAHLNYDSFVRCCSR